MPEPLAGVQLPGDLPKAHLTALNRALASIASTIDLIDRAESCGTDCQAQRDEAAQYREEIERIKQVFFRGSA